MNDEQEIKQVGSEDTVHFCGGKALKWVGELETRLKENVLGRSRGERQMNYSKEEAQLKELRLKLKAQIEETDAQLKELRRKIEAEKEAPPVWKPEDGETYYTPRSCGIGRDPWFDSNPVDKYYLKIGKVFKTEQEAEDYDRALKLIETIRRERYKAQGKWYPNQLTTYTISWNRVRNGIDIDDVGTTFTSDVFGLWRDLNVLHSVIKKHEPELRWYFAEYLPSIN